MFLFDHNFSQFIHLFDTRLIIVKDAINNDYYCVLGFAWALKKPS